MRHHFRLWRELIAVVASLAACSAPILAAPDAPVSGTFNLIAAANGGQLLHFTSQADATTWAAANVIDGRHWAPSDTDNPDAPRGWSSRKRALPQEFTFAFAANEMKTINKIVIDPVTADPFFLGRGVKDVEVGVSTTVVDGAYHKIASFRVRNIPEPQALYFIPTPAKFVRLTIRSNWGSNKFSELGEIELYEPITADMGDLEQVIVRQEQTLAELRRYRSALEALDPDGQDDEEYNLVAAVNGGGIVGSPSQADDSLWAASNLIDGLHVVDPNQPKDRPRGWMSAQAPSKSAPQEIVFHFAGERPRLIDRVRLDPRTYDPPIIGRQAKRFAIEVLGPEDNAKWEHVGSYELVVDPKSGEPPIKQTFDFKPVEAKQIKLKITSNYGSDRCCELGEFEVLEARITSTQLDGVVGALEQQLHDLKLLREKLGGRAPGTGQAKKELDLLYALRELRKALAACRADTGAHPASLSDLARAGDDPPAALIGAGGQEVKAAPEKWAGPYLTNGVPANPLTGTNEAGAWRYEARTGEVRAGNEGVSDRGVPYSEL